MYARGKKILTPSLLISFSVVMALLFPSVMYVDDYFFFGLKSLGSPIEAIVKISETNSPAYSVYFLFSIFSTIFSSFPIHYYLFCMSFLIWAVMAFSLFRFSGEVLNNFKGIFLGFFLLVFLLDHPSNQNIFWSTQAVGSYIQHLLPVLILMNWILFRPVKQKYLNVVRDISVSIFLFGFPGEILICTVLLVFYLLYKSKTHELHLLLILFFGLFVIFLNLFTDGARNRGAELNRPENLSDIFERFFNFFEFLIIDNFISVFFSIVVGYLLGNFVDYKEKNSALKEGFSLLIALIFALSLLCVSAYQSTYHFIGINLLLQALSMVYGIFLTSRRKNSYSIKSRFGKRNFLAVLFIPMFILLSMNSLQNIKWLNQQAYNFLVYAEMTLDSDSRVHEIEVYNFIDSSRNSIIGPNIPEWSTYGLISLDFVDAGVQEAISVINKS